MYNYRINLVYADKLSAEFAEPHTENGIDQIDSYQEFYERKFLDYVTLNDKDNMLLSKTDLTYSILGSGNLTKRLLTSIVQYNSSNQSLPGYSFDYITTQSEEMNFGALSSIGLPTGGAINFEYVKKFVTEAVRDKHIPEEINYAEPKVWIGPDYLVVTRRQSFSPSHNPYPSPVKLQIFTWDGQWIESNLTDEVFIGIPMVDDQGNDDFCDIWDGIPDQQKFLVTIQRDFFAFAYQYNNAINTIRIYRKDEKNRNKWTVDNFTENTVDIQLKGGCKLNCVKVGQTLTLTHNERERTI